MLKGRPQKASRLRLDMKFQHKVYSPSRSGFLGFLRGIVKWRQTLLIAVEQTGELELNWITSNSTRLMRQSGRFSDHLQKRPAQEPKCSERMKPSGIHRHGNKYLYKNPMNTFQDQRYSFQMDWFNLILRR
jgi:hypothetical protein